MEDRDRSMPQVREEPESDDEPRIDGRSSLDLFNESCKAADAAREAGRRLIALGGTMPEIKDVPRRRSDKPGRKR